MMTRKNYRAFASAMKAIRKDPKIDVNTWEKSVLVIAGVFAADNPRFDFNKFYAACGKDITSNKAMPTPYYGGKNE